MGVSATIDDVVEFIEESAESMNGVNPFVGGQFKYNTVAFALNLLKKKDPKFERLELFDIKGTKNLWCPDGFTNYELARRAAVLLIDEYAKVNEISRMESICKMSLPVFNVFPVGPWRTTFGGMLQAVYDNSPYECVRDIINNVSEFSEFSDLMPYDMTQLPKKYWSKKYKKNLSNILVGLLVKRKQEVLGCSLEEAAMSISKDELRYLPVNRYNTSAGLAFKTFGSVKSAVTEWAKKNNYECVLELIKKRGSWKRSYKSTQRLLS